MTPPYLAKLSEWLQSCLLLPKEKWSIVFSQESTIRLIYFAVFSEMALVSGDMYLNYSSSIIIFTDYIIIIIAMSIVYSAMARNISALYLLLPIQILALDAIYFLGVGFAAYINPMTVTPNTISFSLIFYMLNGVIFNAKLALRLNLFVFSSVLLMAFIYLRFESVEAIAGHGAEHILYATLFSACGLATHFLSMRIYHRSMEELDKANQYILDIEHEHKLSAENARVRDELSRLNRISVVEAMTTSIAHEMNQPIGSALTFAEASRRWICRPNPDRQEAIKAIEGAIDQIARAGSIITSIRRLTGRTPGRMEVIDLHETVRRVMDLVQSDMREKGITFFVDDPGPTPILIWARSEEISQVLLNLVNNAMEAFSEDQREKIVGVKVLTSDNGWVQIEVTDNGRGIHPEDAGRIFESFYTTKLNGSGLGLAICQKIAESHQGSLSVRSVYGACTTFTFRLPLHRKDCTAES